MLLPINAEDKLKTKANEKEPVKTFPTYAAEGSLDGIRTTAITKAAIPKPTHPKIPKPLRNILLILPAGFLSIYGETSLILLALYVLYSPYLSLVWSLSFIFILFYSVVNAHYQKRR